MKFVIYLDAEERFRWRLYTELGEPLAGAVDGYDLKDHCEEIIRRVQQSCADASIEDQTVARK